MDACAAIDDELGSFDFGGKEYRIAVYDYSERFMDVEEATGDVVDDAVYARNVRIEERFNCKIVNIFVDNYSKVSNWIDQQVVAGDDTFDIPICMWFSSERLSPTVIS